MVRLAQRLSAVGSNPTFFYLREMVLFEGLFTQSYLRRRIVPQFVTMRFFKPNFELAFMTKALYWIFIKIFYLS